MSDGYTKEVDPPSPEFGDWDMGAGGISIAIEGNGADVALRELLAVEGIEGSAVPVDRDEARRDGGVLVAIGSIVAIAGGLVTIADKIISWREKWKAGRENRRLDVVLEDARGNRLVLENATREQIVSALQALAR